MKKLLNQFRSRDAGILLLLGAVTVVIHGLTNHQYGFHRDELATLDDARHLAWGYVAYPPITPFIARLALTIFGPSLVGLRFFSSLAIAGAMVFTGLMAREFGGSPRAQAIAAIATGIAPVSLISGSLFQYVAFDYLWWVLTAYLMIRLLHTDDPGWGVAIGTVIGLGMMTKYTMGLFVAGIAIGIVVTTSRRNLRSPWLWAGAALSLLLFLPNLMWQAQYHFISLDFLKAIHARDVRIGRTTHNLLEQLFICANVFTIGIWTRGLWSYFFTDDARRYRVLGWMYVVPLALLLVTRGRSYYLAPAYPMLFAAGTVAWERSLTQLPIDRARLRVTMRWGSLAIGAIAFAAVMLPIAPVNSRWWNITNKLHDNFREEIGWTELVQTVAGIYQSLPTEERAATGILAGNYGEAGAIDLYGPAHGLPQAISGINTYWLRGYGNPPPETIIALGRSEEGLKRLFATCRLVGHITNSYGVENEETRDHPDIFVCSSPRESWDTLWQKLRSFG